MDSTGLCRKGKLVSFFPNRHTFRLKKKINTKIIRTEKKNACMERIYFKSISSNKC